MRLNAEVMREPLYPDRRDYWPDRKRILTKMLLGGSCLLAFGVGGCGRDSVVANASQIEPAPQTKKLLPGDMPMPVKPEPVQVEVVPMEGYSIRGIPPLPVREIVKEEVEYPPPISGLIISPLPPEDDLQGEPSL